MSLHDYIESRKLVAQDPPFYSLIMAAMQKADSENKIRLQTVFPFVWAEIKRRYEAPGGMIDGERLVSDKRP